MHVICVCLCVCVSHRGQKMTLSLLKLCLQIVVSRHASVESTLCSLGKTQRLLNHLSNPSKNFAFNVVFISSILIPRFFYHIKVRIFTS